MSAKNDEKMSFSYDAEQIKITAIIEDALNKFGLLGKISQSGDNSSELAGFEINKLLKEQAKLETAYSALIDKKNTLRGIVHRQEYNKIQEEINDVSKSLKESTKKLCRLFKENKNLNEDILKVKAERDEATQIFNKFIDSLDSKDFEAFEDEVIEELEGHNKLEDFQKREKELITKIKKLRQEIQIETNNYQSEVNEKNTTINKLKEELQKTRTENMVKSKYHMKELKTIEETEKRLYLQIEERMIADKKFLEDKKKRELMVNEKNKSFLLKENEKLKKNVEQWSVR